MLKNRHLERPALRVAFLIWLATCLLVLLGAILKRHASETDLLVAYLMLILSFPTGYIVAAGASVIVLYLYDNFGIVAPGGLGSNLLTWLVLLGAGYLQWFVLVPSLFRRFRGA